MAGVVNNDAQAPPAAGAEVVHELVHLLRQEVQVGHIGWASDTDSDDEHAAAGAPPAAGVAPTVVVDGTTSAAVVAGAPGEGGESVPPPRLLSRVDQLAVQRTALDAELRAAAEADAQTAALAIDRAEAELVERERQAEEVRREAERSRGVVQQREYDLRNVEDRLANQIEQVNELRRALEQAEAWVVQDREAVTQRRTMVAVAVEDNAVTQTQLIAALEELAATNLEVSALKTEQLRQRLVAAGKPADGLQPPYGPALKCSACMDLTIEFTSLTCVLLHA